MRKITDLFLLSLILVISMSLLWWARQSSSDWLRLLLPNLWLIAASIGFFKLRRVKIEMFKGGTRPIPGLISALILGLLLCALAASDFASFRAHESGFGLIESLILITLVPVAEEFFFRGILLDRLAKITGRIIAVILVTGLFALLHFHQGIFVPMAVLSLLTCLMVLITGSVLWAIVFHVGWNALSLVWIAEPGQNRWFQAIIGLCLLLGLALWGILTRRRRKK